jgi:putative hydrolase of the HAD superfamily
MIRNIVFDLGNVLLSWKPVEFLLQSGYDEETTRFILSAVFRSQTWLSLDNGDITKNEAIDIMASKSSLRRDQIESLFNLCAQIIFPLHNNIKLLPELKKQGFKLYYLSNYPLEFFNETKSRYDFFKYFDGGIISAEVNKSKPDPAIYRIFLDRFSLDPFTCLYIDDIDSNVRSAEFLGMKVIHLGEQDSLMSKLLDFGVKLEIASSSRIIRDSSQ